MTDRLFGILNVNKPPGMTSRRVVDRVAKFVRPAKAGHAGTLDPLATGVLVVCVGPATRLVEIIQRQSKEYRAQFILGKRSNTDDIEGDITEVVGAASVSQGDVERLLPRFLGTVEQVPPQFSAVHVEGRRAYQLARAGQAVAIEAKPVEIHRIEIVDFKSHELELEIECGSGTYVRSIGRDLGEFLGCGAVMSALVRTRVGPYRLESASELDALTRESLPERLLSAASSLGDMPCYRCSESDMDEVRCGRAMRLTADVLYDDKALVAVIGPDGELACLAECRRADAMLAPKQVFAAVKQ